MPQRQQSPRVPLHLKTTVCSEANGVVRHSVDRSSPKLDDRRSPRSPLHEKKRGTRVADLETKLSQTQEEVKKLKEQLASAEAAKKDAQDELEETKKKLIPVDKEDKEGEENSINQEEEEEATSNASPATDVFEVVPAVSVNSECSERDEDPCHEATTEKEEVETKTMIEKQEEIPPPESNVDESELNAKLAKIEEEVSALAEENEGLKKLAEEAKQNATEMNAKLIKLEEELVSSKKKAERLEAMAEAAEGAKDALEAEMKRLRVQTEQWRKAAEAAAAVLSAGEDGNGRRVGERCGSMEKNFGGGYVGVGFVGSPGMGGGEGEEGKRRGMKMFGELWKKKGQK